MSIPDSMLYTDKKPYKRTIKSGETAHEGDCMAYAIAMQELRTTLNNEIPDTHNLVEIDPGFFILRRKDT